MALLKSRPTRYGVNATYWRIVSGTIDYDALSLTISAAGYLDAATRDGGGSPLDIVTLHWTEEEFVPVAEPTRAILYAQLLERPEFSGAQSV